MLTYETFYGLREKPFSLSSDPKFFYHSGSHADGFDDLLAGIQRRESLSVLTGDIGTGKTTLCRAVLEKLDRQTFCAFVPDPFASREDLLKVLLMDFGVMSVDDLTSGRLKSASRTELSYLLYEFLGTLAPLQAFVVVVIDEAQNLSVPLLEEIRILSDADGRERQLQVVLVGQLELEQKLKLPEMRQVDQRVSVRCHLDPLTNDGVAGYIAHRLQVAGGSPDRVRFTPDALEVICRVSGGVPRLINRICDRGLHHGHLRRAPFIDRDILTAALHDIGASVPDVPAAELNRSSHRRESSQWLSDLDAKLDAGVTSARSEARLEARSEARLEATEFSAPAPPVSQGVPEPGPEKRSGFRLPPPQDRRALFEGGSTTRRVRPRISKRRWRLPLGIAALSVMALWGLTDGALYMQAQWGLAGLPSLPVPPPAPALAIAPAATVPAPTEIPQSPTDGYVIYVALFQSQARASNLVEELIGDGYPAYRASMTARDGGIREQVLIGPYATRADVDSDLERVRQLPGYDDARAVERSQ